MKERYAVSQMRKQANRMTFGEVNTCTHSVTNNLGTVLVFQYLIIEMVCFKSQNMESWTPQHSRHVAAYQVQLHLVCFLSVS